MDSNPSPASYAAGSGKDRVMHRSKSAAFTQDVRPSVIEFMQRCGVLGNPSADKLDPEYGLTRSNDALNKSRMHVQQLPYGTQTKSQRFGHVVGRDAAANPAPGAYNRASSFSSTELPAHMRGQASKAGHKSALFGGGESRFGSLRNDRMPLGATRPPDAGEYFPAVEISINNKAIPIEQKRTKAAPGSPGPTLDDTTVFGMQSPAKTEGSDDEGADEETQSYGFSPAGATDTTLASNLASSPNSPAAVGAAGNGETAKQLAFA